MCAGEAKDRLNSRRCALNRDFLRPGKLVLFRLCRCLMRFTLFSRANVVTAIYEVTGQDLYGFNAARPRFARFLAWPFAFKRDGFCRLRDLQLRVSCSSTSVLGWPLSIGLAACFSRRQVRNVGYKTEWKSRDIWKGKYSEPRIRKLVSSLFVAVTVSVFQDSSIGDYKRNFC